MPLQDISGNMTLRQAWPKIEANDQDLQAQIEAHKADHINPHAVTPAQIGAETPAGAQAKADAVQSNLTAHIGKGGTAHANATQTTAGFESAADKLKLDGIQSGAEVNQNAFAKIAVSGQPDVDADAKTDTLMLAGGTGITVTTDPATDTVTITATGTATPGAHASSHITGGTDVIPNVVPNGASGLMSGGDKALIDAWPEYMARQAIINGNFDVWQRGTIFTTVGYTADRWNHTQDGSGSAYSISQQLFTLGQSLVPNEPKYFLRHQCTTAPTGQTNNSLHQKIESARSFSGRTITVSFYAKADVERSLGLKCWQVFGSGGTPSTSVNVSSSAFSLTTVWQKFTKTIVVPSISGKTFGSNNDDCLWIEFIFPLNSTFTIDLAQVQVNAGDTALPFQPRSFAEELALCQWYYAKSFQIPVTPSQNTSLIVGSTHILTTATNFAKETVKLPVRMRTIPTVSLYNPLAANNLWRNTTNNTDLAAILDQISDTQFDITSPSQFVASNNYYIHWSADAEL